MTTRCLGDPPTCCQPTPISEAELAVRLARIETYLEWSTPTRCPRCSSAEVCPMFDPDMLLWICTDCGRSFAERD